MEVIINNIRNEMRHVAKNDKDTVINEYGNPNFDHVRPVGYPKIDTWDP